MQTSTQDETHTQDKAGWVGWLQIGAIGAVIVIALVLTAVLSSGGDAPRQSAPERPATPFYKAAADLRLEPTERHADRRLPSQQAPSTWLKRRAPR